jgi:hypothetical protein
MTSASDLSARDSVIIERVRRRYYQPGLFEAGLEFLAQELFNDRPQRAAIARRVATLLREREANEWAEREASGNGPLVDERERRAGA